MIFLDAGCCIRLGCVCCISMADLEEVSLPRIDLQQLQQVSVAGVCKKRSYTTQTASNTLATTAQSFGILGSFH